MPPRLRPCTLLPTLLVAGCAAAPAVPSGSGTGAIVGVARYEGVAGDQSGIAVEARSGDWAETRLTDATGAYTFPDAPLGAVTLSFHHPSYFDATLAITVATASASAPRLTLSDHRVLVSDPGLWDASASTPLTQLVRAPDGGIAYVAGDRLRVATDAGAVRDVGAMGLAPPERIREFDWSPGAFVRVRVGPGPGYRLELAPAPLGPYTLVATSSNGLYSPTLSPDGTRLAYLERVAAPWTITEDTGAVSTGSHQLAVRLTSLAGGSISTVRAFPIHPSWDFGHAPLAWTLRGLLLHRPMACAIDRNRRADGPVGDGLYLLDPASFPDTATPSALTKLWFYSAYHHVLGVDGQAVYFVDGRTVKGRRVDDPSDYDRGSYPVGYDSSLEVGSLLADPRGDRLDYVSGRGVEEMRLLRE